MRSEMFSKKNIIISSIIFIISVIFLILSFNSLFAYNLFEKLLGLTLKPNSRIRSSASAWVLTPSF